MFNWAEHVIHDYKLLGLELTKSITIYQWEARLFSLIFKQWIVIYPVDSDIHPLNNRGLFGLLLEVLEPLPNGSKK